MVIVQRVVSPFREPRLAKRHSFSVRSHTTIVPTIICNRTLQSVLPLPRQVSDSMSGILYTLLGLAAIHCAVRREISPCTCRQEEFPSPVINQAAVAATVAASSANTNNNAGGGGGGGHHVGERIEVVCEKMKSFDQLAEALSGKFTPEQQITLRVTRSNLRDISRHDFKELRMSITRLELNHDYLG